MRSPYGFPCNVSSRTSRSGRRTTKIRLGLSFRVLCANYGTMIEITVPNYRLVQDVKPHYVYTIKVLSANYQESVERRYSAFHAFHREVSVMRCVRCPRFGGGTLARPERRSKAQLDNYFWGCTKCESRRSESAIPSRLTPSTPFTSSCNLQKCRF